MIKLNIYSHEKLVELLKEACSKEAIYWTERKQYPDTDELVTSVERDEVVSYFLEVCERDDVSFSVETFSLFVTLLDRFLASYKVKSKYLECLAVACLYIASKVKEEDDNISITAEFLLDCDAKCSVSELLRMEQMVLTKFEWNVNDTTHSDFLYIYYALVVDKYREIEKAKAADEPKKLNIWKYKHAKSFKLDNSTIEEQEINHKNKSSLSSWSTSYPPIDLDFLHLIETQLKQCLCIDELTNSFRPHMLAYSLLSIQLEKWMEINGNYQFQTKQAIIQTIDSMKQISKLNDEDTIDICKEKIKYHLDSIETSNNLFDKYLSEYHTGVVNSFRTSLFAINTDLPAIKEEEEEDDNSCVTSKHSNYVFKNISNMLPPTNNNIEKMESSDNENNGSYVNNTFNDDDYDSELKKFDQYKKNKSILMNNHEHAKGLTYADILIGRTRTDGTCICEQQKRKLSENSSVNDDDELLEDSDEYYYEDDDDDYDENDDKLKDDNYDYEYDQSQLRSS